MSDIWKVTYPMNDWFYVNARTILEAVRKGKVIASKKEGYSKRDVENMIAVEWIGEIEN